MRFSKLLIIMLLLAGNSYASTLLVVGDSISAGYGINPDNGWVNLLRADLEPKHQIINASISGDTTGNGLARLPLLQGRISTCYSRVLPSASFLRRL